HPSDITNVVREQNRDFPAGLVGREPAPKGTQLTIPVITQGRLTEVKDFEEMIVRALPNGDMVRLKDVAKVELGAQSYNLEGRWNGKPNTSLITFLSPGANALDTAKRIQREMDELAKSFPPGVKYNIPYDTTRFIEVSIHEVALTLGIAMVLVVLVVYLFLQSWRTTLIPAVAVGFLGGITCHLYQQFPITIAISVTISGFVALTLSPALCALVLKPGGEEGHRKGFFSLFNTLFDWTRDRYTAVAAQVIKRAALALAVFGVVIALAFGLLRVLPASFLPEEDQGYFIT